MVELGINYTFRDWTYQIPDQILDRDFGMFEKVGLKYVTILSHWIRLEPQIGKYNEQYIQDMKHVCSKARQHGLKVILDNHTVTQGSKYSLPTWCKDFTHVVMFETERNAYIHMLEHLITAIPDCDTYQIANEPVIGKNAINTSSQNVVNLFSVTEDALRLRTSKPLSVRFAGKTFYTQYKMNPRLFKILDYIAINYYRGIDTLDDLVKMSDKIKANNMEMWITEYGTNALADSNQVYGYREYNRDFALVKPKLVCPWIWEHPTGPASVGYNLCSNPLGQPRPAFNVFLQAKGI